MGDGFIPDPVPVEEFFRGGHAGYVGEARHYSKQAPPTLLELTQHFES